MSDEEAGIFEVTPELQRRAAEIRAGRTQPRSHPYFDATAKRIHRHGGAIELTPRYRQILAMVAEGDSNQEIADKLVLGIETVKTHMRGLLRAFDARNRWHVVSLAYRHGFLTVDDEQ